MADPLAGQSPFDLVFGEASERLKTAKEARVLQASATFSPLMRIIAWPDSRNGSPSPGLDSDPHRRASRPIRWSCDPEGRGVDRMHHRRGAHPDLSGSG